MPVAPEGITAAPSSGRRTVALVVVGIAILIVHSALIVVGIGEVGTVIVNVVLTGALVAGARRASLSNRALGLRITWTGVGVAAMVALAALALAVGAALVGALPAAAPGSRPGAADVAFRLLVAIPIGTAACEELLFRGVLLAAWTRQTRRWPAARVVSGLFGLWHIAPEAARLGGLTAAVIPAVVATAAVSLLVLCPLRTRFGLVAPMALHAATNMSVFVLSGLIGT